MKNFLYNFWPTFRRTIFPILDLHFKINSFIPKPLQIQNSQSAQRYITAPKSLLFLYPLFASAKTTKTAGNFEVEKKISRSIATAEGLILKGRLNEAKSVLENALNLADEYQAFGSIAYIYDLLTSITFQTTGIMATEDMIATFIEKLQQMGYPEDHNYVVKFKLKLARLYQVTGNRQMAEYGYRDCINMQEKKIKRKEDLDESSNLIYINSLFWYGRLLQENSDFSGAKTLMKKSLQQIEKAKSISVSQKMVVLYHNASISEELKEFDDALSYLYQAIEICLNDDSQNPDLAFYVVKVGSIHMLKGIYDVAEYWCETANTMAKQSKNETVEKEACDCLNKLKVMKPKTDSTLNATNVDSCSVPVAGDATTSVPTSSAPGNEVPPYDLI